MKKIFSTILLTLSCNFLYAQRPLPDHFNAGNGGLMVLPIFHGAFMMEWNQKVIYVDPYGGPNAFAGLAKPDIILITDIHGDHLDTATLNTIDIAKATFIVPQAVADQLPERFKRRVVILKNGDQETEQGVSVTAIPMYNLPDDKDARHTKGRGNGYVLKLGGKSIYISGDTEDIPEMRSLKNIDIAFVCMNIPYTMDVKQAAEGVLAFKPKVVYPYHYRGENGFSDTHEFQRLVTEGNPNIEVRLRNWYTKY